MLGRKTRSRLAVIMSRIRVRYYRAMGVTIGEGCYVSSRACIDARRGQVTIGDHVSISGGSYILGHTGARLLKEGQETKLEDNVKVYVNAVVLPGITVGANSIVAAGAVVARDVPPSTLVMGNPARVVQHLGDEKQSSASGPIGGAAQSPGRERPLNERPVWTPVDASQTFVR